MLNYMLLLTGTILPYLLEKGQQGMLRQRARVAVTLLTLGTRSVKTIRNWVQAVTAECADSNSVPARNALLTDYEMEAAHAPAQEFGVH